ncbi:MAG: hypothetical protein KJN63_00700, partial [Acidimicrobiia bacterium]|nr:hypothetical protein [Acidimicrobiia bacterium]
MFRGFVFVVICVLVVVVGCGSSADQTSTRDSVTTAVPAEESTTVAPSTSTAEETPATSAGTDTTAAAATATSTTAETTVDEPDEAPLTVGELNERRINSRKYYLYVPLSYDPRTPAPLVLDLHGAGETPRYSFRRTDALAEETGAVFAYPEADVLSLLWRWDSDFEWTSDVDAVYIGRVIDDVESLLDIDPERVYAIGHSRGGGLSTFLPCHLGSRLSAVVTNVFLMHHDPPACRANEPIDLLVVVSDIDPITSIGETYMRETFGATGSLPGPWTDELAKWTETNSCGPGYSETTDDGDIVHRIYSCEESRLEVYQHPFGHIWS